MEEWLPQRLTDSTEFSSLQFTLAKDTSGYWVEEWLPQMVTDSTEEGLTLSFIAICDWARLQSRRVRAVKFSF